MSRRILSIEESRLRVLPGSQRRGNCRLRMIALAALFLSLLTATPPDLRAQRHDRLQEWQRNKKYFDGLRSRGLYSLAETVCHRKLSGQTLDLVTSTRYAVELSRTLAEHSIRYEDCSVQFNCDWDPHCWTRHGSSPKHRPTEPTRS
jgi:hypothetical protein